MLYISYIYTAFNNPVIIRFDAYVLLENIIIVCVFVYIYIYIYIYIYNYNYNYYYNNDIICYSGNKGYDC